MSNRNTIRIHDAGKIDIHNRQAQMERAMMRLREDSQVAPENKALIFKFIRDCKLGKTVLGKSKKKIGPARCLKYIGILSQLSGWFCKPFDDMGQDDMESFIELLESDQIRSQKGKPFSDATKVDIKKTIKKFWKWKDGNNKNYPDLVAWIDTYEQVKDVPALSREEVERMINQTNNLRDKALIMVLFDSGARIEELLNVRLKPEHIQWKEELNCYMMRLEYSKTKPRTISIPLSMEHLKNWLEVHPCKENAQAQLFPLSYGNLRMLLHRIGKRVLDKRVSAHLLRHSSATFYANRLKNSFKLCYRYGWTMASDMVNRYLDREGILEHETAEIIRSDEVHTSQAENRNLREELSLVREANAELSDKFDKISNELTDLRDGKGVMKLLTGLVKRQQQMERAIRELKGKRFDVVLPSGLRE